MLLGGGNGLFASGATSRIGVDGPGLAGSTAGWIIFCFWFIWPPSWSGLDKP